MKVLGVPFTIDPKITISKSFSKSFLQTNFDKTLIKQTYQIKPQKDPELSHG